MATHIFWEEKSAYSLRHVLIVKHGDGRIIIGGVGKLLTYEGGGNLWILLNFQYCGHRLSLWTESTFSQIFVSEKSKSCKLVNTKTNVRAYDFTFLRSQRSLVFTGEIREFLQQGQMLLRLCYSLSTHILRFIHISEMLVFCCTCVRYVINKFFLALIIRQCAQMFVEGFGRQVITWIPFLSV